MIYDEISFGLLFDELVVRNSKDVLVFLFLLGHFMKKAALKKGLVQLWSKYLGKLCLSGIIQC